MKAAPDAAGPYRIKNHLRGMPADHGLHLSKRLISYGIFVLFKNCNKNKGKFGSILNESCKMIC